MKKILSLLIAICVIPTVHADPFTDKPGVVDGCVTDSETNEGINGVTVTLFNSSLSESTATHTKGMSKCSSNTGIGAYDMDVPPGTYNMTFTKTGYITQARGGIVLVAGQFNEQNASIVPKTGFISITSAPTAADIFIDTSATGEVTSHTFTSRVGTHVVSVSKEGYLIPSTQTVEVTENGTTSVNFTLEPEAFGVSLTGDNSTGEVYTDEEAVYTLNVENTGNTQDTYTLTYSNPDNAVVSLGNTITLVQGDSAALTLKVKSADVGTYQICATATSLGDSTKSSTFCTTTDVVTRDTPDPDVFGVSLVGDNSTDEVYPDEEAVYNLTVQNTGNAQDIYALTYSNPDNATANLSNTNITLNQGASAALTLKVKSADVGTYQICATATSLGDSTKSSTFCTTTDVVTRDTPGNTDSPGGGSSSSESSTADLTIFQEEIFTEDHLLDFMHKKGDAYGSKHAFNRGLGALASLYAAKGEKVTSTGMADALLAAYPESETGMVRVEGGDIYQLAADYVMEHYSSPKNLIIVRGDLTADSLVATPLSALLDAPILLVEPGRIPDPDFEVLDRRYERIYIIGGPAAVSKAVEQGLGNYSDTIIRIWGETRYETSVEVAREVRKLGGNDMAILTNGEKPVLYSATLSNMYLAPILYLDMPPVILSTGTNPHQETVSRYISEQALDIGMIYHNESLA